MMISSRHCSGSAEFSDAIDRNGLERQSSRRKGMDKSILDDIMGDPDDFKELVDPEEDGGRWEDTVKEALHREESLEAEVNHSKQHKPERRGVKSYGTRYFIIKSLNHQNLAKSVEKGVWATQAVHEDVLNEAFQSSERVILVFSVNTSGYFQGYAEMTSRTGRWKADLWNDSGNASRPSGGVFSVKWLKLYDLPYQETSHLKNPVDDNKPVKVSRDCQELPPKIGEALCALIDEGEERDARSKRKKADGDAVGSKRQRDEQNSKPEREPQKSEKHSPGSRRELDRDSVAKNKDRAKDTRLEKTRAKSEERDRKSRRPAMDPEEDLLNMTYEDYLRRHSRTHQQFNRPVGPWINPGMPDPYAMSAWYERGRPEAFYGIPPARYGAMQPFDPTKWRGHPR